MEYAWRNNQPETQTVLSPFAKDILDGLSASPKYLSSKYFYDDVGSQIFQTIMRMPEYYLTDCEYEIFTTKKQQIFEAINHNETPFDLVELGAGDGLKTKVLLEHFQNQNADFYYVPIDISAQAINELLGSLRQDFQDLKVKEKIGDYFEMMHELNETETNRKVLLFLGSNIGNFGHAKAVTFFRQLAEKMQPADKMLVGFDLKKDPNTILRAYNDPHGHTAAFNLNLLKRINRELDADFDIDTFQHYPTYDPQTGTEKSYLVSKIAQTVKLGVPEKDIQFDAWEPIFMEISQKYDETMIKKLAGEAGFWVVQNFYDPRHYFASSLWELQK